MATYIVVFQMFLMCCAILVGGFLLIRRRVRAANEPIPLDTAFDRSRVAAELQAEIQRLDSLKRRLDPTLPASFATIEPGSPSTSAETPSAPVQAAATSSENSNTAAPTAVLSSDSEAAYKKQIVELEAQVKKLNSDLQAQAEAIASGGTVAPASAGGSEELELLKKAKKESDDKVAHLERVLSEYQIFEEDFALVKKYKSENEVLRKQLSESQKITEDEIGKLFESMEKTGATAGADSASEDGEFFGDVAPAVATAAPGTAQEGGSAAATTVPESTAVVEPVVVTGDQPIEVNSGSVGVTATAATEPALATQTAAIGSVASPEPSVSSTPNLVNGAGAEPSVGMSAKKAEELADAAVNDDALIKEFEKILGDKPT